MKGENVWNKRRRKKERNHRGRDRRREMYELKGAPNSLMRAFRNFPFSWS